MSIKHDYKTVSGRKSRRKIRLHGLLVILLVLIGLFGALLAYINDDIPRQVETKPLATSSGKTEMPDDIQMPPAVKPKYDFYEVLPERQVVIPAEETPQQVPDKTSKAASQRESVSRSASPTPSETQQTNNYIVQAGSFLSYADADRRKATIAFLGIPARIEKGVGADGRVLHRIHIGPVQDIEEVKRLRQRLKENDIQSLAISVR